MKIKNCKLKICNGFTLVELLVVIAIISILTIISLASFTSAQTKAKDSQRKSDLEALSKALMMYFNDNGKFPEEDIINDNWGNSTVGFTGSGGIVYMRKIPEDPKSVSPYIYDYEVSDDRKYFNLFANLENKKDGQCLLDSDDKGEWEINSDDYCYGISSPNEVVKNWP